MKQQKLFRSVCAILSVWGGLVAAPVYAESSEVAIERAFVPPQGYDDNDNVNVVVFGYLPNACYEVGQTVVERDDEGRPVGLRQFIERKRDGICAEDSDLPLHLSQVMPFQAEANLGRLAAGRYSIRYLSEARAGQVRTNRVFEVAVAPVSSVDSLNYATVGNAVVNDVASTSEDIEVTISGLLTSTCVDVSDDLHVERLGDVVVVRPTIIEKEGEICAQVLRAFHRTVKLGQLNAGSYLLHVRSQGGRSLSRVFHVESAP